MGKLKLDFTFAVDRALPSGISAEKLEEYRAKARVGFSRLIEMVEGGEVGFPHLPAQDTSEIKQFAKTVKGRYNDFILIGIGGSSLGIEAVVNALLPYGFNALSFADRGYNPRIWVMDNVDPSKVHWILRHCEQADTFVCVISKSGSTVETAANFCLVHDWMKAGVKDLSKHMCVITDPVKGPLRDFAKKNNIPAFDVQPSVGGRFSVLCPVGLIPAAIMGIDIDRILNGAAEVGKQQYRDRLITAAALYMYFTENGHPMNVLMSYSSRLDKFNEWFCQLWGESLGKLHTRDGKEIHYGSTPIRSLGAIDQHSQVQLFREGPKDKLVTFIELDSHDFEQKIKDVVHPDFAYLGGVSLGSLLNMELHTTESALLVSDVPSMKLVASPLDEAVLGELFMFFMYIVPIVGLANNIDPFDQPGVEEGKKYAFGLLGREGYGDKKSEFEAIFVKNAEYVI